MLNFAVRPAHRGETVVFPEDLGKLGINIAFVITLMCDDLSLNNRIGFDNHRCSFVFLSVVERIGDRSQPLQAAEQFDVTELKLSFGGDA